MTRTDDIYFPLAVGFDAMFVLILFFLFYL